MSKLIFGKNQKVILVNVKNKNLNGLIESIQDSYLKTDISDFKKAKRAVMDLEYDLIFIDIIQEEDIDNALVFLKKVKSINKRQRIIVSTNIIPSEEVFVALLDIGISIYLNDNTNLKKVYDKINDLSELIENEKFVANKKKEIILNNFNEEDLILEKNFFDKVIKEKRNNNVFLKKIIKHKDENILFLKEIKNLMTYDNNLDLVLLNSVNGYTIETLEEYSFNLRKIKEIFILNNDLKGMGLVIGEFSNLLLKIVELNLPSIQKELLICNHFKKDISSFLINIFLEGDVQEFNYLTDSFQSSIKQLEAKLFKVELDDDDEDEDFDFF
jgi:hypothetical protein